MNLKNQSVGFKNEFLFFEIYLYLADQSDSASKRRIIPVNKAENTS